MARPKKDVSAAQVEKLAAIGCTDTEIGDVVGLHSSNVARRFAKELTKGRASLRERLRRKQLSVAMGGNIAMLIWLGKQYLDQSDRQEIDAQVKSFVFSHSDALARIAPRPVGYRLSPGDGQDRGDGAALGKDDHGG